MPDKRILQDEFNLYYANAKSAYDSGNYTAAKQNYLLAAKSLLILAKESSGDIGKAQAERAKRLIELADKIPQTSAEQKGKKESDTEIVFSQTNVPSVKFSDIAGLEEVKKAITMLVLNPLKYPEKYAAYEKKMGGGILLFGPSGTGKTMIAKAIANEANAKFYSIKGSDIVSKWVGESEKNISELFRQMSENSLSILFIDEMDSLFASRGQDSHNDRRVNEFLQQIDGVGGRNPNLLIIGATNRPWDIDSAALRSGRFSQKIYMPLPDYEARLFLMKKFLKNVPGGGNIDYARITVLTDNYSGADIEEICERAKEEPLLNSLENDELCEVTNEHVLTAIRRIRPTVTKAEIQKFIDYMNNA